VGLKSPIDRLPASSFPVRTVGKSGTDGGWQGCLLSGSEDADPARYVGIHGTPHCSVGLFTSGLRGMTKVVS